jgi:hypothetical protein
VRTLAGQIPAGDEVLAAAATTTPAGVQIVGIRRFHQGGFDRTPLIFPTATSNAVLMNNPPSDSTQGFISAVTYVPSLGVLEAGQYNKLVGSTLSIHAVVWNGTPNSGVDVHVASNTNQFSTESIIYGVSPAPVGFQAAGLVVGSGRDNAAVWTGATPQTSQVGILHNYETMFQSRANGAYTFDGVAKQVGYSQDFLPGGGTSQPRARVWSGSAASATDLTPGGFLYGVINGGNGDGPNEILYGHIGATVLDARPTIWTGTGGEYTTLDTTAARPTGSVVYASQAAGVGHLWLSAAGGSQHAALWNLADGTVTDLHSLLPPEYQFGGTSTAFYVDALGNVYGHARVNGGSVGVPVVWTPVPEPGAALAVGAAALAAGLIRRTRRLADGGAR